MAPGKISKSRQAKPCAWNSHNRGQYTFPTCSASRDRLTLCKTRSSAASDVPKPGLRSHHTGFWLNKNMARIARVVIPSIPHHITQRGNRRQQTFFGEADYKYYIQLLAEYKEAAGVEIWAYCLMPNHVHIVAVPQQKDSLSKLFRPVHQRYSRAINSRFDWRGHLWQERFYSSAMDETHTIAAVRYVELNPVRAMLCSKPDEWLFSSARAHLEGREDRLINLFPMRNRIGSWRDYLAAEGASQLNEVIRRHCRTGRPLGSEHFIEQMEQETGRVLRRRKRAANG